MSQDHWFLKVNGETELLDPYHMYYHQHSTLSQYCSYRYKIQLYCRTSVHCHGVDTTLIDICSTNHTCLLLGAYFLVKYLCRCAHQHSAHSPHYRHKYRSQQ